MASNLKLATGTRNLMLDGITTRAGASALLNIYAGSQPADANTAISGQTLLAQLTCNATFAPSASGGDLTLNSITSDSDANATGTAAFFRLFQSNGTTVVLDGTVGTSDADMIINSTAIQQHAVVAVTSAVFTAGNA